MIKNKKIQSITKEIDRDIEKIYFPCCIATPACTTKLPRRPKGPLLCGGELEMMSNVTHLPLPHPTHVRGSFQILRPSTPTCDFQCPSSIVVFSSLHERLCPTIPAFRLSLKRIQYEFQMLRNNKTNHIAVRSFHPS